MRTCYLGWSKLPLCGSRTKAYKTCKSHPLTALSKNSTGLSIAAKMKHIITALFPFIPLALTAPLADDLVCKPIRTTYTARYDDLPYVEPGPNPIPPHYYGLSYFTFQVDQYDHWIPPTSGNQWTMAFGGSGNISIPDQLVSANPSYSYLFNQQSDLRSRPFSSNPSPLPASLVYRSLNAPLAFGDGRQAPQLQSNVSLRSPDSTLVTLLKNIS